MGAIASNKAAEVYGLDILAEQIQDQSENFTRFFVIGKKLEGKIRAKTSIVFTLEHKRGTLAEILSLLSEKGLNLTKIASRPIPERPFEYLFYVDIEGVIPNKVLETLKEKTQTLKQLGEYDVL